MTIRRRRPFLTAWAASEARYDALQKVGLFAGLLRSELGFAESRGQVVRVVRKDGGARP